VKRIPVTYKGKPLMPMKYSKAAWLVKEGKAKLRKDKDGIWYLKLKFEPSGKETQEVHLGIDPGTHFDGFSVVSEQCHHENIQINHNKSVKDRMSKRSGLRRVRRSRLRHRKIRFDNRTSEMMVPTIRSMFEFRKFIISKLTRLYPISKVIIEDVAYNHWKETGDNKERRGSFFSQCEIGKSVLYEFIRSLGIKLTTVRGYITKNIRTKLFGEDLKLANKGVKSFYAHCVDSLSLGTTGLNKFTVNKINEVTRFISKIWLNRRELSKWKARYSNKKYYFRYLKGGIVKLFSSYGKLNICRVKPAGEHSNHPKEWEYINNGRTERFKYSTKPTLYGGTIVKAQSRYALPVGISKRVIYDKLKGILGFDNRIVYVYNCAFAQIPPLV